MTSTKNRPVVVTFLLRHFVGEIWFASSDRLSLLIKFDGKRGAYDSLMPVIWLGKTYVDLFRGRRVQIQELRDVRVERAFTPGLETKRRVRRNTRNGT